MDWLQDILAPLIVLLIAAMVTAILSIVGYSIRSRKEESRVSQQKLNEERRNTYRKIISPYIGMFTGIKDKEGTAKALDKIKSPEHKEAVFDLIFFGSDNVVKAHNALFQYAYKDDAGESSELRGLMYMRLWGTLLLEIRKDVGNKDTKLDEFDMLRWLIRDIDKLEHTKDRER